MADNQTLMLVAAVALLLVYSLQGDDTEKTVVIHEYSPYDPPDYSMHEVVEEPKPKKFDPGESMDDWREREITEGYRALQQQYDEIISRLSDFRRNITPQIRKSKILESHAVETLHKIAALIETPAGGYERV